jgi:hypothetical protein
MSPAQNDSETSRRHIALIGGIRLQDAPAPSRLLAVAVVGGANVDLTRGTPPPVFTLTKIALVGGTRVRVPRTARVELEGFSLIGRTRPVPPAEPTDGEPPVVRIRAYAFWGGVRVERG